MLFSESRIIEGRSFLKFWLPCFATIDSESIGPGWHSGSESLKSFPGDSAVHLGCQPLILELVRKVWQILAPDVSMTVYFSKFPDDS